MKLKELHTKLYRNWNWYLYHRLQGDSTRTLSRKMIQNTLSKIDILMGTNVNSSLHSKLMDNLKEPIEQGVENDVKQIKK